MSDPDRLWRDAFPPDPHAEMGDEDLLAILDGHDAAMGAAQADYAAAHSRLVAANVEREAAIRALDRAQDACQRLYDSRRGAAKELGRRAAFVAAGKGRGQ